jgi:hypothetical protein
MLCSLINYNGEIENMASPVKDAVAAVTRVVDDIKAKETAVGLMIGSSALHTVSQVSLKNADYLSKEVSGWDPALLTSRAHYFEAGLVSLVCFIHNCVFALIFGLSALVSLCKDQGTNHAAKKYLLVSAMSGACIGTSILGLFSPSLGHKVHTNLYSCLSENSEGIHNFLGAAN